MHQQGGQRPYGYARSANKGMCCKAGVGFGQQGANFVKGRGPGGAKPGRSKELHTGNMMSGGIVLMPLRQSWQLPRAGSKAGRQTLRQGQGRLAERVAGKRFGTVGAGQDVSGFRL